MNTSEIPALTETELKLLKTLFVAPRLLLKMRPKAPPVTPWVSTLAHPRAG